MALGLMLLMLAGAKDAFAQPTVLGSQVVNGGYSTTNLVAMSAVFKQIRLQATSGVSAQVAGRKRSRPAAPPTFALLPLTCRRWSTAPSPICAHMRSTPPPDWSGREQ